MAEIRICGLSKSFQLARGQAIQAIDRVDLNVQEHERLVILGPSGSGKTTLLRLIAGLDTPDAGEIFVGTESLSKVPARQRRIAMIFQNAALYPHQTVRQNVALNLKLAGTPKTAIAEAVAQAADAAGITTLLDRYPESLSGGQRQRVALARALVRKPAVFLLDEPLSNLDPVARAELRREIVELSRKISAPMIYVTHDQHEAMEVGTRIAILNQGKVEQVGTPLEIYRAPASLFGAQFVGSPPINLVPGKIEDGNWFRASSGVMRCALPPEIIGTFQRPVAQEIILGFRPEQFSLAPTEGAVPVQVTVAQIRQTGPDTILDLAEGMMAARIPATDKFTAGQNLRLYLDCTAAIFFNPQTGKRI